MSDRLFSAPALRRFVHQVFQCIGYAEDQATDATDVLLWASLRGVETHGVRNLKSYYVDRTMAGMLKPSAELRLEHETPHSARLDGHGGLGLSGACRAMRLAINKCRQSGVGLVCVRNMHHLGPAGYFAHMAVEHGMLGACLTGHFFGRGHAIGVAPLGSNVPMFSTNPLSFAAPCGRHAPFVLDMSTSIVTVNRIEMLGQAGRAIPAGWACDAAGQPTTDPAEARVLLPLGGTPELGGHKGWALGMMVSVLTGVLSGAWAGVEQASTQVDPERLERMEYDQPTMGHFFAAVQVEALQPLAAFTSAIDAMIDALHAVPTAEPNGVPRYPGELEAATAAQRSACGIPISDYLHAELQALARQFDLQLPHH